MKEKIVFFGAGPYVVPILDAMRKDFDLSLIVTTEKEHNSTIISYSRKNNINFASVESLDGYTIGNIENVNAQIAILAYFGIIVPKQVLDIFPLGIINIHPSLLPKYRGPTPGQTAILDGEKMTGVSIIKLDEEIDHGPILAEREEPIREFDNSDTLYLRLFTIGANLLGEILPLYVTGEIKPVLQDHSKATFTKSLTRKSGFIDFKNPPKKDVVDRMVRAYFPWPSTWFKANINGREKIIKLFPNKKIQVEGKNIMQLSDFTNGYPEGKEILAKLNLNG